MSDGPDSLVLRYLRSLDERQARSGANLTQADLSGVKVKQYGFTDALSQAQLDHACGTDAKLPEGFTLKPCPAEQVAPPLNLRTTP